MELLKPFELIYFNIYYVILIKLKKCYLFFYYFLKSRKKRLNVIVKLNPYKANYENKTNIFKINLFEDYYVFLEHFH